MLGSASGPAASGVGLEGWKHDLKENPQFWAEPKQKTQPEAHAEGLQRNHANVLLVFKYDVELSLPSGSSASRGVPGVAPAPGAGSTCGISPWQLKITLCS